LLHIILSDNCC